MRRWAAVPLALLFFLASPGPARGWVQSESSKGAKLFWGDSCLTMYLNERGSEDVPDDSEFDEMKASFEAWGAVSCSSFLIQFAGMTNLEVTGHLKEDPAVNMIVFREKKWPYSTRPVAFTAVTYNVNTGEIFDADIEMNGEDYAFTTKPEVETWKIDVQNTITHELGHVLGIDHSNVVEATMFDHAGPSEVNKRTLEEDDIEAVCTLYPLVPDMMCTKVEPSFLFYDFPEEREEESCNAHPVGAQGSGGLGLLLFALLAMVAIRRRVCA
jgi:MYXO-CTERM domain-containing protein